MYEQMRGAQVSLTQIQAAPIFCTLRVTTAHSRCTHVRTRSCPFTWADCELVEVGVYTLCSYSKQQAYHIDEGYELTRLYICLSGCKVNVFV